MACVWRGGVGGWLGGALSGGVAFEWRGLIAELYMDSLFLMHTHRALEWYSLLLKDWERRERSERPL